MSSYCVSPHIIYNSALHLDLKHIRSPIKKNMYLGIKFCFTSLLKNILMNNSLIFVCFTNKEPTALSTSHRESCHHSIAIFLQSK